MTEDELILFAAKELGVEVFVDHGEWHSYPRGTHFDPFTWEWLGKGMEACRGEWEIVIWTQQVMIYRAGAPENVRCVLFDSVADVPRAFWQCLAELKGQS